MDSAVSFDHQFYRHLFEHNPFAVCMLHTNGQCITANTALCELLGYPFTTLKGKQFDELSHPEDLQRERQLRQKCLNGDIENFTLQKRFIHQKGHDLWVSITTHVVRDHHTPYFIQQIFDDTERQATEHALKTSEERLKLATAGTNDGIWDWKIESDEMYFSPRFLQLLGYTDQTWSPYFASFERAFHPDEFNMMMRAIQDHLYEKQPLDLECRLRKQDGEYHWFRIRGQASWNAAGQPVRMSGSIMDIAIEKEIKDSVYLLNLKLESRVKERTAELEKSEQYNRTLFEESPVGLALSRMDGQLIDINQAFANLLQGPVTETLQLSYHQLFPDAQPSPMQLAHSELGTRLERVETLLHIPNGDTIPVLFNALILEQDGQAYIWSSIEDIRWRKQAEQQLIDAKEKAESANRAKSAFLATMSHEIRTPMNGIVGMIDVLNRETLTTSQLRMLQTIRTSGLNLLTIINDILDLSKIEAGKLSIQPEATDLRQLIEQVLQTLSISINEKKVQVITLIDESFPHQVVADPIRIKQILFNLIGNAIKFTAGQCEYPTVTITLSSNKETAGQYRACLQIADNGIGIPFEQQEQLFKAFHQADDSTTRKFGGTGLGLVITQRLVELMQGDIQLHSAPQQGTEFTLHLPLRPIHQVSDELDPSQLFPPISWSQSSPDIYLFIQKKALAQQISYYLRQWHVSFRWINEEDAKAIAALPAHQHQLCIFDNTLSALADPHMDKPSGKRLHLTESAVDFEPVNPNFWLLGAAPLLISQFKQAITYLYQPELSPSHAIAQHTTLPSFQPAHILLAEDNPVNQEVILSQLQLLGLTAHVCDDGRQALQYWRNNPVDLLLTDLHMPEMDGYQLIEAIRSFEQNHGLKPISIVGITADVISEQLQQLQQFDVNDVLTKPIQLETFQQLLSQYLNTTLQTEATTASDTQPSPPDSATFSRYQMDALTAIIGPDKQQQQHVMIMFRDTLQLKYAELCDVIAAQDAAALKSVCHALKSSARSIGAVPLTELCQCIEDKVLRKQTINWQKCEQRVASAVQETHAFIEYWMQN